MSWPIEIGTFCNCSVHRQCRCRYGPVEQQFSTFYLACPLCFLSTSVCLYLYLCITIIYLSIPLEVSVSIFLSVVFSFNFSFNFLHFLIFSISPAFFFQLSLLFQLGERLAELLIHCFISDKQCDHSQFTSLLHFKFLPCKRDRNPPSTSFPELLWEGYNGWQQKC